MPYPFLKGHGTENDFVLLPDLEGLIHGELSAEEMAQRVRALCDRHAGIGGDGVLRVLRAAGDDADWSMDYRNSDGSLSEMCGNGIRLFVRYLLDAGLADGSAPIRVDTRDGVKTVTVDGDLITVDMGTPKVLGDTTVGADGITWAARHVDIGNPHAVAFASTLEEPGRLLEPPVHDPGVYPDGVNVEFVVRRGERHIAMRVHERGSGETRSCGTGACAAMVATAVADQDRPGAGDGYGDGYGDVAYRVDVPGGTLTVTWTADDRVLLTGPAVIVASGQTDL
jgi:diaminopimelate epimerase